MQIIPHFSGRSEQQGARGLRCRFSRRGGPRPCGRWEPGRGGLPDTPLH